MKTYKELKEFINDLESDLDRYYKYPNNDFLINAIIKENENCLKFYKRIKYKFENKFKYSLSWCCKYNKEYDLKKFLKHNEKVLKPYHLNKELLTI